VDESSPIDTLCRYFLSLPKALSVLTASCLIPAKSGAGMLSSWHCLTNQCRGLPHLLPGVIPPNEVISLLFRNCYSTATRLSRSREWTCAPVQCGRSNASLNFSLFLGSFSGLETYWRGRGRNLFWPGTPTRKPLLFPSLVPRPR